MTRCGWNTHDRRECEEPGEILLPEGPRFLCRLHAPVLERLREEPRQHAREWLGYEETQRARAARLRGLG